MVPDLRGVVGNRRGPSRPLMPFGPGVMDQPGGGGDRRSRQSQPVAPLRHAGTTAGTPAGERRPVQPLAPVARTRPTQPLAPVESQISRHPRSRPRRPPTADAGPHPADSQKGPWALRRRRARPRKSKPRDPEQHRPSSSWAHHPGEAERRRDADFPCPTAPRWPRRRPRADQRRAAHGRAGLRAAAARGRAGGSDEPPPVRDEPPPVRVRRRHALPAGRARVAAARDRARRRAIGARARTPPPPREPDALTLPVLARPGNVDAPLRSSQQVIDLRPPAQEILDVPPPRAKPSSSMRRRLRARAAAAGRAWTVGGGGQPPYPLTRKRHDSTPSKQTSSRAKPTSTSASRSKRSTTSIRAASIRRASRAAVASNGAHCDKPR